MSCRVKNTARGGSQKLTHHPVSMAELAHSLTQRLVLLRGPSLAESARFLSVGAHALRVARSLVRLHAVTLELQTALSSALAVNSQ